MNRNKELQASGSNFNFTLDFRKHYPNGLLLFSVMKQQTKNNKKSTVNPPPHHHLLVALKNGRVVLNLGRKQIEADLTSTGNAVLQDGQWHRVHVIKDKRKVTLIVDDGAPLKLTKGPTGRVQLDGQLFVGGLSESMVVDNAQ